MMTRKLEGKFLYTSQKIIFAIEDNKNVPSPICSMLLKVTD